MPYAERMTVFGVRLQATPSRGAKLFVSGLSEVRVVERPVARQEQRVRGRVEVGQIVVVLPLRRPELVAQPEVEREVRRDTPIVLDVAEMHPPQFEHERVDELVGVAGAVQEVDQIEGRRVGGRAGGRLNWPP